MKTIGIVCDNHKQAEFEKRLKKKGLTDYEIFDFGADCKTIKVKVQDDEFYAAKNKIAAISYDAESFFKRTN